jgi:hypothetical protein
MKDPTRPFETRSNLVMSTRAVEAAHIQVQQLRCITLLLFIIGPRTETTVIPPDLLRTGEDPANGCFPALQAAAAGVRKRAPCWIPAFAGIQALQDFPDPGLRRDDVKSTFMGFRPQRKMKSGGGHFSDKQNCGETHPRKRRET